MNAELPEIPRQRWLGIKTATMLRSVVAVLLVALVAIVGIAITLKVADFQRDQYFDLRKQQVAAAAAAIEPQDIEALTGTTEDYDSPTWRMLRDKLIRIKTTDPSVRFVYIMKPAEGGEEGEMVFLVDAEPIDSEDYSPPGCLYQEEDPAINDVFEGKADPFPEVEFISDEYGDWVSATSYITKRVETENEEGETESRKVAIAYLGTDVDVNEAMASFNDIKYLGILLTATVCVLLALVLLLWIVWMHNRDKRRARRLEMEAAMVRLNEELLEADRLKSEFIAAASHELRGPVTAIQSALAMISKHVLKGGDELGRELSEIALKSGNRLMELVNNLLDLTRMDAGGYDLVFQETDLRQLVEDTVKIFKIQAEEEGLEIKIDMPEKEIRASVDPQAVRRVLENLIGNAIKYTERGFIVVGLETVGANVRFMVKDTGRGIPERFKDEVFKRFSRLHLSTDSDERGAGLGLSICKGLVEAHGGQIRVESVEGVGSTFYFELPLRPGDIDADARS